MVFVEKLGSLLHHCSKLKSLSHGASLHSALIKSGVEHDLFLSNHLLNMYAKCGKLKHAHKVFDEMPRRNLVSFSALISGYDQSGEPLMALNLFSQLEFVPNEYIYGSVLSACATLLALSQGEQVHADVIKTGFFDVSFVSNSLISMYMKCSCFHEAYSIFGAIAEPNLVSYNAMIGGFAENGHVENSLELFRLMNQRGLRPDQFSYVAVVGICTSKKDLDTGVELHCQSIKLGLDITAFVGNVILTMYSKSGSIEEVEKVFNSIIEKDVITWNSRIVACSHFGDHAKGIMVYKEMIETKNADGVRPDEFTFASALACCAELASIQYGGQIHSYVSRTGWFDADVGVSNALIDMYAKCGWIGCATKVFNLLRNRNLVSWNTMIVGLGNHGLGKRALEIFQQMEVEGICPDSATFVGLLISCSHAGLVDKGLAYFDSMRADYNISPKIEHLSCLIDMLGRAGRLEEAECYIHKSPFNNDSIIWGSLLSSCFVHRNVVVGERAAKKLFDLQPRTSSPFVLLSNLYALDARWDGVAEVRKLLKDVRLKKEPGHSVIEAKGIVEKFTAGDYSHARIEEVAETLVSLSRTIRMNLLSHPQEALFSAAASS
ncbi:Pentatricopeptide repeat-containing protein, partial [Ananas comosus]